MNLRIKILFFYLLGTSSIVETFAQNQVVDSLKLALKNAKHDTTRAKTLNALGEQIYSEQPDSALMLWQKANKISEENKNKYTKGGIENKAILLCLATSLNNIGFIYNNQGDIPKALEYFSKSLKIQEEVGDKNGMAYSLNNIGLIYDNQGDIPKALEYFSKSLKIQEELGDKIGLAAFLNNIGFIYSSQGDIPKALEYYTKSLKIQEEIGDKIGIATSLNNIGGIYQNQGDIPKALEYYRNSLKILEEIGDKIGIATSLNNIGAIYTNQGKLKEGFTYAKRSMDIAKELGYPANIKSSANTLKSIFQKQNKYKDAFEMYELEIKMRDSINNQETQKAAIKKQMQYTYEKQEAVAKAEHKSELDKQQAVADEKSRKQKIIITSVVIGLLLVIIFAGFVFKTLRATRKQKLLIELKNKEIEEKQKEILDSIHYAKRIQTALIPSDKYIDKSLSKLQKRG